MKQSFKVAVTGQSLIHHDVRSITAPAFQGVCTLLRDADLSFTNFEGTIFGRFEGWPLKGSYFGCSDPAVLDALQTMGFRALSLSNNHAFDLGPSGILSTLEEVEQRGFLHAGIGRNHGQAAQAGKATIGGRQVAVVAMDGGPGPDFMYAADAGRGRPERPGVNRLGVTQVLDVDDSAFTSLRFIRDALGYNAMDLANDSQPNDPPHVDGDTEVCIARAVFRRADHYARNVRVDETDLSRNLAAIAGAAQDGSMVIAYLHHHHWARDWTQVPKWVSYVARKCIDAGAAMFVSHGAPVLQPVEIYRKRPIFYSLGNFIFHVKSEESAWTAPEVWESVVGSCSFDDDNNLIEARFSPVVIGGHDALQDGELEKRLVPQLAIGASAERILRRFCEQSSRLGARVEISDGTGILRL
ncbi:capsule biosynthesis protein CapA [Rhizobium lusitanum]|uniref:Capsule biosynthesis protein CapA n=1 Tax=Rhizobium lusitanum TaxID=293958 RepID=A0A6L9UDE1_9HYPH|nr:CapA family protein [Rhizobium lusitanum]NEI73975.1 capsule biosynthesis protein CapA [Rhizobium lusitanum]